MYAAPAIAAAPIATGSSIAQKSVIASAATVVCVVVFVFLLGGTVAVALIPLYTPNRSVAPSVNALNSKEVTMIVDVEENNTVSGGRRKRFAGDLYDYVGSEFGPTGRDMMATTLGSQLSNSAVRGLNVSSVVVALNGTDTRRKRHVLSKRATTVRAIVIIIRFYVLYVPRCTYSCQLTNAPLIRTSFLQLTIATFVFTNVPMYRNGEFWKNAPRIRLISIVFITVIVPGLVSGPDPTVPVSGSTNTTTAFFSVTNTTTTPATTTSTISAANTTTITTTTTTTAMMTPPIG